jgi:hypothetical protein
MRAALAEYDATSQYRPEAPTPTAEGLPRLRGADPDPDDVILL